ncbi:MAG: PstS family phosphate ABC transporter substrate-binding protein [Planctomycetes bacterium]|nr:PstS family phosphate ABC transporter substrate-binding protein [Planctomycetota bacterium]
MKIRPVLFSFAAISAALFTGCGGDGDTKKIVIDGSSTVGPVSQAMAELYADVEKNVAVEVGISGTGGGFVKFIAKETQISDASRPVKEKEEASIKEAGFDFIEVPVCFDGLTVVINKENTFATSMTVAELKKIWEKGSAVTKWSDVREGWPAEDMTFFSPGSVSGTFDYFTEAICGESGNSRQEKTTFSEDDNVLVRGVESNKFSIGYFGFAYYVENKDRLTAVAVDGGSGPVVPTMETITNGTYSPLSRPIFIYVSTEAAKREEVAKFVEYYLDNAPSVAKEVGYVPFSDSTYALIKKRFADRVTGSVFRGAPAGTPIDQILTGSGTN